MKEKQLIAVAITDWEQFAWQTAIVFADRNVTVSQSEWQCQIS
jgi:hypothetical protein